jgi:hypothetical protein
VTTCRCRVTTIVTGYRDIVTATGTAPGEPRPQREQGRAAMRPSPVFGSFRYRALMIVSSTTQPVPCQCCSASWVSGNWLLPLVWTWMPGSRNGLLL